MPLLLAADATGACTPVLSWQFDGAAASNRLGNSVSYAGDVDNDGFDDVIVGAYHADPGGLTDAGSAYVYSGQTGALLWQFNGSAAHDEFGISVSGAGDVDNDGFDDVIVGANYADADSVIDAGSAYVYSGQTGALLWQFDGTAFGDNLGFSVSGAGDVDNDGFDDLIVGASGTEPDGVGNVGSAYVYSGQTGALMWQFDGATDDDQLGASVSGAGDVNNDGFDDLIVGTYRADPDGLAFAGSAFVYSGLTGALLWQFDGATVGSSLGRCVSGAGDVDNDGFDDVIVGAPGDSPGGLTSAGSAYVYSGQTGTLLLQLDGAVASDQLGYSVSGAGDIDNDGSDDLIVGARSADPGGLSSAGSAYVYGCAPLCTCLWQGDMNADGVLDAVDLNALIDALFFTGPDPQDPNCPTTRGDFNDDGVPDATDLNALIDAVFFNGPDPCDPCNPIQSSCAP